MPGFNPPVFRDPRYNVVPPPPPVVNGYPTDYAHLPPPPVPAQPDADSAPFEQVDYQLVRRLHSVVAERLGSLSGVSDQQVREVAEAVVQEHCDSARRRGEPVSPREESLLLEALLADLIGLGRLQLLLKDPAIENIHIFGHDRVRIEYADGTVREGPPVADDNDELLAMLQTLAVRAGSTERSLSTSEPWLDLELPDGSRLAALYEVTPPSEGTRTTTIPFAQIRRHRHRNVTLDDLVGPEMNMISPAMRDFLRAAMAARLNIMVAGVGGAGKTTLIRALAAEIPPLETFAVLEESRELGLHTTGKHPYVMSLESRQGHGELRPDGRPKGEIVAADLIPRMLRMSVQRIIVGEVRSREIIAMLQAMTVSQGSLCTIHARRYSSVFDRIVELGLSYGRDMTAELVYRMAANALDLIIFVELEDETPLGGRKHRYISHIVEVDGRLENGAPVRTELFAPGPDGRGVPTGNLPDRIAPLLRRVGYDPRRLIPDLQRPQDGWPRPIERVIRGWA